ncbi:MAG: hypothetical protein WD273_02445 [Trueperaceae bacterium]
MNQELVDQLRDAQQTLEPGFKDLREATTALKKAVKLASDDKPDALPMHKVLLKLEQSAAALPDGALQDATEGFRRETERALDALGFDFAKDLRDVFSERGVEVGGRPPTLLVGELILRIDIAARKAQWFYGNEQLTGRLPLSSGAILKAFEQQQKLIAERDIDAATFLRELFDTWRDELQARPRRGNRLNLVETHGKMTMARQSARFWNAPSRRTFKDYPRPLFVRDLVLTQTAPTLSVDGERYRLRLGVATKSQADSASRSVWLPNGGLEGEYYSDLTFEEAPA